MEFKTFDVGNTNIFPIANSTTGGQLMTEWNLRSRESVGTHRSVDYMIGPSYVHSERDFEIQKQVDSNGKAISNTVLQISPGRAVINGHFVEVLTNMIVDLGEGNAKLPYAEKLNGLLYVGIRVMYSTEATMAGSMKAEDGTNRSIYEGLQIVVLPNVAAGQSRSINTFNLPTDVPNNPELVTAHLKLGTVYFNSKNGTITTVTPDPERCLYIEADRIKNIDALIANRYVNRDNLNPGKFYAMAGKADADGNLSPYSTWCDVTDSTMIWDNNPIRSSTAPDQSIRQATFARNGNGISLIVPHKQIDGMSSYLLHREISLPVADYNTGTPGIINSDYTKHVKDVVEKFNDMYKLPTCRQIGYIERLVPDADGKITYEEGAGLSERETKLPKYIRPEWADGDYFIVGQDTTQTNSADGNTNYPSTMYMIVPGKVVSVSRDIRSVHYIDITALWDEVDSAKSEYDLKLDEVKSAEAALSQSESILADEQATVSSLSSASIRILNVYDYASNMSNWLGTSQESIKIISDVANILLNAGTQGMDNAEAMQEMINRAISAYDTLIESVNKAIEECEAQAAKSEEEAGEEQDNPELARLYRIKEYLELAKESIETMQLQSAVDVAAADADYKRVALILDELDKVSASLDSSAQLVNDLMADANTMYTTYVNTLSGVRANLAKYLAIVSEDNKTLSILTEELYSLEGAYLGKKFELEYEIATLGMHHSIEDDIIYAVGNEIDIIEVDDDHIINGDELRARLNLGSDCLYRGRSGLDYFTVVYTNVLTSQGQPRTVKYYVNETTGREYSQPLYITGRLNIASDTNFGGVLSTPENYIDGGYITVDAEGRMRLIDYELLRSGTLAYQLGQNITISGATIEEVQDQLDNYVNMRVAFRNSNHVKEVDKMLKDEVISEDQYHDYLDRIDVTVTLPENESEIPVELNINAIDCRFNTSVHLSIQGTAGSNVIVNIQDCQRLIIDSNIGGEPIINLYRSCVYYDANVLNEINHIEDISFWYQRFEDTDPDIIVDGMTIMQSSNVIPTTESLTPFIEDVPNDIHFTYGLHSVTFDKNGNIVGCGLYVTNGSTDNNVSEGKYILADNFRLPQSTAMPYPERRLVNDIKVTGSFVTGYPSVNGYILQDTKFTALIRGTGDLQYAYLAISANVSAEEREALEQEIAYTGCISFYVDVSQVHSVQTHLESDYAIDGWMNNSPHIFRGFAVPN